MQSQYSMRSPAVKRLMKEMMELKEPTEDFYAQPIDDNLFEWHFTVRGPEDSEFEDGYYHGRIILPPEYPMKPPSIILLTPNGRFELNKKICLSISGYHPESWQPSWSIRTALLAIIGFMPTHGNGAIGSLNYSAEERKMLAKKSEEWNCRTCGNIKQLLRERVKGESKSASAQEAKQLASQITFKSEEQKNKEQSRKEETSVEPTVNPNQSNQTENTAAEARQRISSAPPAPATTNGPIQNIAMDMESQSRRESMVAIVILSVAIAVLLLRRFMLSYFQTSI